MKVSGHLHAEAALPSRKWSPIPYSDETSLSGSENTFYSRNIKMYYIYLLPNNCTSWNASP